MNDRVIDLSKLGSKEELAQLMSQASEQRMGVNCPYPGCGTVIITQFPAATPEETFVMNLQMFHIMGHLFEMMQGIAKPRLGADGKTREFGEPKPVNRAERRKAGR